MSSGPVLELEHVVRTYKRANESLEVVRDATLTVMPGELVGLVGPSGAGKSTLLHVAGLLEMPDGGDVSISGRPCGKLSDSVRTTIRRNEIGFVYQFHHLLPEFSAEENVILPQMITGKSRRAAKGRAQELIAAVGLSDRAEHRPARLSGGEQQRVAIARALANEPRILLADEPTGNLDSTTGEVILDLLEAVSERHGIAMLVVTHSPGVTRICSRTLEMRDGVLVEQGELAV